MADKTRQGVDPVTSGARETSSLWAVLLFAAALLFLYISAHREMSYVDELQHFDYLAKISRGNLVHRGETVGPEALREMACRGIDVDRAEYVRFFDQTYDLPPCGAGQLDPRRFPELGINHASVHPPAYYFLTGVLARLIRAVSPVRSLLTAARMANLFWLTANVLMLWLLLRDLGANRRARMLICGVFVSSPPILQTFGAVGPDAAAPAMGAALVLAVVRWERASLHISIPIVVAALSIAVKETNAVAVGLAVLYLVIRGYQERPHLRRNIACAGLMTVVVFAAGLPWLLVQSRFADLPTRSIPMVERFQTERINADQLVSGLDALVTPVRDVLPPIVLRSGLTAAATELLHLLLLGGAFAAATAAATKATTALGGAGLAAMVATGPLLVITNYVLLGIYVVIPQRYGLSLLPALFVALGAMVRKPWLETVLSLVGLLGIIALLHAVLI